MSAATDSGARRCYLAKHVSMSCPATVSWLMRAAVANDYLATEASAWIERTAISGQEGVVRRLDFALDILTRSRVYNKLIFMYTNKYS